MSRRHQDWDAKLFNFTEARRDTPFAWGTNDCCMLACDAVLAITGIDLAAPAYRKQYDSALGAARLLLPHGGVEGAIVEACAVHGFAETPVPFAQRGDLLLLPMGKDYHPLEEGEETTGDALGYCVGAFGIFPGPTGLVQIPVAKCSRAWRTI